MIGNRIIFPVLSLRFGDHGRVEKLSVSVKLEEIFGEGLEVVNGVERPVHLCARRGGDGPTQASDDVGDISGPRLDDVYDVLGDIFKLRHTIEYVCISLEMNQPNK